ncbi:hypothetical protein QMK33_02420 [Hymenobacter sp. H14-R3]|uniref:hypothetical protein n=1 Tax=Hymenobacter sp. H14-R3 TaxID=3046308 RepID=UPI0024B91FA2|nr:hypothetical protein [Hymenobacter sp. H14-R3]MDJ0363992.1 hypothetical protein [Hymenobacter sp. H14-R3]
MYAQTLVRSPVIFTTAYDQYALQAFRANGIDYLLKPLKLPELQAALAKLSEWGMKKPEVMQPPRKNPPQVLPSQLPIPHSG